MRILLIAAAAALLATSASAQAIGNNAQDNDQTVVNAPVTTVAPVITNAPVQTNALVGSGNSAVTGSGNSANLNNNASSAVTGASTSTSGATATSGDSNSSAVTGASTSSSNSGGNQLRAGDVNINHERNPVSSAFAIGSAGVGEGMCRFGPGFGAQGITAGYNFSLPIFKDGLCARIAKDGMLVRKVSMIAAIAGNEAAVQWLAARDPEFSAAVTLARRPAQ